MKLTIAALLLTFAGAAYASCQTSTITANGRTTICTTCCYQGVCNTVCS